MNPRRPAFQRDEDSIPIEVAGEPSDHERPAPMRPDRIRDLAPPPPEIVASAEPTANYLPSHTSEQAGRRWQLIQADFVDDPRKSVAEAHELVGELMQRIIDGFTNERDSLERQWTQGEQVSTEELRVCLQRYRAFFTRLLPAVPASDGPAP